MKPLGRHTARVAEWVGRGYIAGPLLGDALELAGRLDRAVTFGFWDAPGDSSAAVAGAYGEAIDALAAAELDGYVSVKLPALGDDPADVARVAAWAREAGVLLHFDSLQETLAERTVQLAVELSAAGGSIGASLPGSWSRSVRDAARLAEAGVRVRVVKGQWSGDRDPVGGFLDVVDVLVQAGGAAAVATHDPRLAAESLERLQKAGGGVELELLYGLPRAPSEGVARRLDVPTRIYISYGHGYVPYVVAQIRRKPRILWWLLRDAVVGHRLRG